MGVVSPEAYSTAWLALVPAVDDPAQPAWPQAVEYLRTHQLEDGGWGEPHIYFAHERLISTLAALYALSTWKMRADDGRIARGVEAVCQYVDRLGSEPEKPVGFELLLPALLSKLEPFDLNLPPQLWSSELKQITAKKMSLIGKLDIDYSQPRTWWFSLEMLPEQQLAEIDPRILDSLGSIITSTTSTAAYLRALRVHGRDSSEAAHYLDHVLRISGGSGVGFCWPIEMFEIAWVVDAFMRAGANPRDQILSPLLRQLSQIWDTPPQGLAHSRYFPLNDVDDTAAGYYILRWAGLRPSEKPLLDYWHNTHFVTYADERTPSTSSNVHALSALRHHVSNPYHKKIAIQVTDWLRQQMDAYGQFNDKWHSSPVYVTSHAVTALLGWDDELAQRCINYLIEHQHESGGWGNEIPNQEETAHAVLGLIPAWKAGLLKDTLPLKRAANYFKKHKPMLSTERLWIGKTLYQPIGISLGTMNAAQSALMTFEGGEWAQPRYYEALSLPNLTLTQNRI